jgi:hypothetical protein
MASSEVRSGRKPVGFPAFLYFLGFFSTLIPVVVCEASTPEAARRTFGANGELTFGVFFGFFAALVSTVAYGISLRAFFQYPFTTGRNVFSAIAGGFTIVLTAMFSYIAPYHPLEALGILVFLPSLLGWLMSSYWE